MVYLTHQTCMTCKLGYLGYDTDNNTCPECERKLAEKAEEQRATNKQEFIATVKASKDPIATLAAEIFELKNQEKDPPYFDPHQTYGASIE